MKNKTIIAAILMSLSGFTSCVELTEDMLAEPAEKVENAFSKVTSTACFNYDGGELEYDISDIANYTLRCDADWLTATKNGNTLRINCKPNADKSKREVNVIMYSGSNTYAVAFCQMSYPDGFEGGHAYVTLGGTSFATCNIGASKPSELGYKYAWGETNVKNEYLEANYKYNNGGSYTKYTIGASLDASDDAATVNWGDKWCMSDHYYDISTYKAILNGVSGHVWEYNSKIIFLPEGNYWSKYSSPYDRVHAYDYTSSGSASYYRSYKYEGHYVRPVLK